LTTLLAIDIGNTNVSLGLFDYPSNGAATLSEHWRIGTHREQTSDETALTVRELLRQVDRRCEEVTDIAISSVVPPLLPIWERVSTKLFGRSPLVVGPGIRTGIPVLYDNPREVGADRIVNSLAAFELLGGPVIAVDFGTATTFDCVSKDGEYLGGAIFPGIHTSMAALFERASMLGSSTDSQASSTRWSREFAANSEPTPAWSPPVGSRAGFPPNAVSSIESSPS